VVTLATVWDPYIWCLVFEERSLISRRAVEPRLKMVLTPGPFTPSPSHLAPSHPLPHTLPLHTLSLTPSPSHLAPSHPLLSLTPSSHRREWCW